MHRYPRTPAHFLAGGGERLWGIRAFFLAGCAKSFLPEAGRKKGDGSLRKVRETEREAGKRNSALL